MPERKLRNLLYRWRVRSGPFVLVGAFVLARPGWRSMAIGFAIAFFGLLIRAWAAGHILKEKRLAVTGPYRHSRNPLYVGNAVIGAGLAVACWSWPSAALVVLYFGLFYPLIVGEERERMRRLFPRDYEEYAKNVPLFLPRLKPSPPSEDRRFRWALYLKNKEWRAPAGAVASWALLIGRMLIRARFHF